MISLVESDFFVDPFYLSLLKPVMPIFITTKWKKLGKIVWNERFSFLEGPYDLNKTSNKTLMKRFSKKKKNDLENINE